MSLYLPVAPEDTRCAYQHRGLRCILPEHPDTPNGHVRDALTEPDLPSLEGGDDQ